MKRSLFILLVCTVSLYAMDTDKIINAEKFKKNYEDTKNSLIINNLKEKNSKINKMSDDEKKLPEKEIK